MSTETYLQPDASRIACDVFVREKQVDKWQPWPKEKKGLCLPDEAWKRWAR